MEKLVDNLIDENVLNTKHVIDAFRRVDRADFVPEQYRDEAYADRPLPLMAGQTISQPYTVALMLEMLRLGRGQKILDVGSGSGWTTALLAKIAGSGAKVYGVEVEPGLVEYGQNNLAKYRFKNAEILAAGGVLGLPNEAPFDRILVSAAAKQLPDSLTEQLSSDGVMVVPVGSEILEIERRGREINVEHHGYFAFVPLVDS